MAHFLISMTFAAMGTLAQPAAASLVPDQVVRDADAGYFHRVLPVVEPLAQANPQDAEVQFRYGQALLGLERCAPAIVALKSAIGLDPKQGIYHRVLAEAYETEIMTGQVGVFSMFGVAKSMLAELQSAVQLAPADVRAHEELADYYMDAPGIAGGSFAKARIEDGILSGLDPLAGLRQRAREAGKRGDAAAGEVLLQQAVAQDTTSASLMALGFFYVDTERYDDAIQAFRAAGTKDPKTYAAWYQIGRISGISRSDYQEGVESLQRYLAAGELPDTMPGFGWAHLRLGDLYQHEGQVELARSEYQAAAGLRGDDARLASEIRTAMSRLE